MAKEELTTDVIDEAIDDSIDFIDTHFVFISVG